jgi:hypothetical protein
MRSITRSNRLRDKPSRRTLLSKPSHRNRETLRAFHKGSIWELPGRNPLTCLFPIAGDSKLGDRFGNGTRQGFQWRKQLHIGIGTFCRALHNHPRDLPAPLVNDRCHESL